MIPFMSSLRWRLYLTYLLLAFIIFSSAGILIYTHVQSRLITNRLMQTRELVYWALTKAEPVHSLRVNDIYQIAEELSVTPAPDFSFFLLDINGELVRSLGQGKPKFVKIPLATADFSHISAMGEAVKYVSRAAGDQYRTLTSIWPVFETSGSLIGAIQSAVLLDEADIALSNLTWTLVVGFSILFVVASSLWFFLIRAVLRPLDDIGVAARAIAAGGFGHRMPVPRIKDEAYYTTIAFNQMSDSVQEHISREKEMQLMTRRFLADASHELRSPLTVLKGYVDVLRRGAKDDPEALQNALEGMHTTVGKMTRLTNDMLSISQLDAGRELDIEVVDLNSLCRSTIEIAQTIAGGKQLEFQPGPEAKIRGDAQLLEQVLWNLLDNSIRHTGPQGRIVVGIGCQGGKAHITVQDDGEGIPPEHLPRIFERFYRVDPSRPGGSGLGLSIVKAIVERHRGNITVQSTPGQGTTFIIAFPLAV